MAFEPTSRKEGEGEEEEEEEEEVVVPFTTTTTTEQKEKKKKDKTPYLDVNGILALSNLSEEHKQLLLQALQQSQPSQPSQLQQQQQQQQQQQWYQKPAQAQVQGQGQGQGQGHGIMRSMLESKIIVTTEEYEKITEIQNTIEEITKKQTQTKDWISRSKKNSELCQIQINQKMDQIIALVNQRRQQLIEQVVRKTTQKIRQCQDYIQQLQQSYQTLHAFCRKVEEKWSDITISIKNRKDEIIKESSAHIEQYKRSIQQYQTPIIDSCYVYWNDQSITPKLKTIGRLSEMELQFIELQLRIKHKTHNSITVVWDNKNKNNTREKEIKREELEFIIQFMEEKKIEEEEQEKNWNEIKIKKKMHEIWEYTIRDLKPYTNYTFRIQSRHPSSLDIYSPFSDLITCQTNIIENQESEDSKQMNKYSPTKLRIKNALVIMIGICKYGSDFGTNITWPDLDSIKNNDIPRMKHLFQEVLHYTFIHNDPDKFMTSENLNDYLTTIITEHELIKNKYGYDAIILIISGHADSNYLITSDGMHNTISTIFDQFNSKNLNAFAGKPKIVLMDMSRGDETMFGQLNCIVETIDEETNEIQKIEPEEEFIPKDQIKTRTRMVNPHQDYIFLHSTAEGFTSPDYGYFFQDIDEIMTTTYEKYSLQDMIDILTLHIGSKSSLYCVETIKRYCHQVYFQPKL